MVGPARSEAHAIPSFIDLVATMGYHRCLLFLAALFWAGAEAKNVEERKIQVMNER